MTMVSVHQACLLLGSNNQPERNLPLAIDQLQNQLTILRISGVWETPPVGSMGPNFLNAALLAQTPLEQKTLKFQILTPLEAKMGRVRSADKNAPRPIDLDIILFDGLILDPTLWHFAHRAVPVAEIQPDICSEAGETLKDVAAKFMSEGSIRLRPDVVLLNSRRSY
ncbi:MAG TPA: 2-amino-4-hydroxy-6-hydroxymethyldihydropteridine diphosphokinase [Anaerolineales bacterium]